MTPNESLWLGVVGQVKVTASSPRGQETLSVGGHIDVLFEEKVTIKSLILYCSYCFHAISMLDKVG